MQTTDIGDEVRARDIKLGYLLQAGVPDIRQQPPSGPAAHVRKIYRQFQNHYKHISLLINLDNQIWKSTDLINFAPIKVRWLDQGPYRWIERFVRRVQYEFQLPYAAFFESIRFAQACRQELSDCDLFYERMGWMGYGGGLAANQLGIPLILEVNGDHLTEFENLGISPKGVQRHLSLWLMKRAAHNASHVVATGEGWRQKFIDRWQFDPDRITVVENGSEMVNLLKREDLRSFQPLAYDDLISTIIYVGAIEPWHGVGVLVEAFGQIIEQGISAKLLVVGSGTEIVDVKKQVQELNLEQSVEFTGHVSVDYLTKYLAQAVIGVSPYCGRVEYSGLKILDYKAAGLATIASGENGHPSVLEHGRNGWIVTPCDVQALSKAIMRLCLDADLRRQLGQAARIEAEQRHSWGRVVEQLGEIFEKVVAA